MLSTRYLLLKQIYLLSLGLLILALVHFFSPMFWKSVEQMKQIFLDFHSPNPSYSARPLHVGNTRPSLKVHNSTVVRKQACSRMS